MVSAKEILAASINVHFRILSFLLGLRTDCYLSSIRSFIQDLCIDHLACTRAHRGAGRTIVGKADMSSSQRMRPGRHTGIR